MPGAAASYLRAYRNRYCSGLRDYPMSRLLPALAAGVLLSGVLLAAAAAPSAAPTPAPASRQRLRPPAAGGEVDYKLDPRHTSVIARVQHQGYSHFAIRFGVEGGTLIWDPTDPTKSKLDVTLDPKTIHTGVAGALDKEVARRVRLHRRVAGPFRLDPHRAYRAHDRPHHYRRVGFYHGVTKPVTLERHLRPPPARLSAAWAQAVFSATQRLVQGAGLRLL